MAKLTSIFAFGAAGMLTASLFVRPPVTPVTTTPVTTAAKPSPRSTQKAASTIASPPPPSTTVSGRSFAVEVVAFAPWGSGPAEVGRILPKEANPEGPMSLAVDGAGWVHVLDQVNARIQVFDASGTFVRSVKIPSDTIQDLAIDPANPSGGYALLDRLVDASLIFIDGKGTVTKKVQLEGQNVPTPGVISALFAHADGFWVEVEHKTLVRVALANGDPDPARLTLEGRRPFAGSPLLRAARDPSGLAIVSAMSSSSSGGFLARVPFTAPVMALEALEGDTGGNVFVAAHTGREGPAPAFAVFDEKLTVVALSSSGAELGRFELPPPEGPEEVLRSMTISPSGMIHHLHVGALGATIRRAR